MSNKRQIKLAREPYARSSYLFQAAAYHLTHGNPELARMMGRGVDLVSKRAVLRMLPHLKRKMCKKCKIVLIDGLTMAQEIENLLKDSPKADVLVHTCLVCKTKKRFPIGKNPSYELHCDKNRV